MIYFFAFSVSMMLSTISENLLSKKHPGGQFFAVTAVISISVLNLIRDYTIGTDVLYYGNNVFNAAVASNSLSEYIDYCNSFLNMHEYGYAFINWLIARISTSPHIFYFVLGLLTNGFVYAAICRTREWTSVPLSWLTYLLVFFPTTLNMLRQGLALAIVSYAFLRYKGGNWKWYCFWVLVACSMHLSAFIALALWPFYKSIDNCIVNANNKERIHRNVLLISAVFLTLIAVIPFFIDIINNFGLLPSKYAQYVSHATAEKSLINPILIRLPFALLSLLILLRKNLDTCDSKIICLFVFVLCEFSLLPLQNVSDAAFRVSLYFGIFKIIAFPAALVLAGVPKWVSSWPYLAYIVFIFVYQVIYSGNGDVYPFVIAADLFR